MTVSYDGFGMKLLAAKKVTTSVRKMQMTLKRIADQEDCAGKRACVLCAITSALDC
jgi:hypothetical protein